MPFTKGKREQSVLRTLGRPLGSMRLHGNMRIEVIQSAVSLFTAIPATLVHALNLLVSPPGALVLLSAGDRNERVNLVTELSR